MKNEISEEDMRAALRELKTYVDITEEDLMEIYRLALKHASERPPRITVADVMTKDVITVKEDTSLHEAARILSENRISGMPVVNEENYLTGIITEADIFSPEGAESGHTFKDILRRTLLGEPQPLRKAGEKVGDVMNTRVITTAEDKNIGDVAKILDEKRIKRLPVVDHKGILRGIISRADIVRAVGQR
ncbi:MAG: CBS domain-containing protein [Syntrophales bacterium]|nr:CBS domain-containing protein [Syntrophales bacterium]